MRRNVYARRTSLFVLAVTLLAVPASFRATPRRNSASAMAATAQPNIGLNGFFSSDRAQRGRTVQAAIVMDIPQGFHVNANKPLGKYAIPTTVKIEAPAGVRVGPVSYPRAVVRRLPSSNNEQLAYYEGRAVMRFNVTLPANYDRGEADLRARIRFQSCNDEVCFPPVTREVTMQIGVVGANESVKRVNGEYFGGRRRG